LGRQGETSDHPKSLQSRFTFRNGVAAPQQCVMALPSGNRIHVSSRPLAASRRDRIDASRPGSCGPAGTIREFAKIWHHGLQVLEFKGSLSVARIREVFDFSE
jgi:hypothetical protein